MLFIFKETILDIQNNVKIAEDFSISNGKNVYSIVFSNLIGDFTYHREFFDSKVKSVNALYKIICDMKDKNEAIYVG